MPLPAADVEATRTRARRRLIGMAVLVGAGLIGFPWLFETQPRPMSGDVQIVQAGSGADGEVQISGTVPARSSRAVAGRVAVSGIVVPSEQDEPTTSEGSPSQPAKVAQELPAKPADKNVDKPTVKPADKPSDKPSGKTADKAADKAAAKEIDKAAAKEIAKAAGKDGAKDSAKPAADKEKDKEKDKTPNRYVVQFGAFADANTAHEARMKVERLGLKTYTQQVDTPAGKRIRVRMGPYADKAEADKAMATLRKANLSGAVLTL